MKFNDNLINKLKKIIPSKIMNLGINMQNTGHMRFDSGLFNSIYIRCEPFDNCISNILKFLYIDDTFVFKNIYLIYDEHVCDINNPLSIINPNPKIMNEFRYDSELNLECKYEHYSRKYFQKLEDKNEIQLYDVENNKVKLCTKDGKIYWFNREKTKFSDYFNFLKKKNFIDECFGIDECKYLSRDESSSIYLEIK